MAAEVVLVVFLVIEGLGALIAIAWWRDSGHPIPLRVNRQHVFRYVHREDRAAYRRIMRRTLAIQMRDLGRQFTILGRTIGKALLPSIQKLADRLGRIVGS